MRRVLQTILHALIRTLFTSRAALTGPPQARGRQRAMQAQTGSEVKQHRCFVLGCVSYEVEGM